MVSSASSFKEKSGIVLFSSSREVCLKNFTLTPFGKLLSVINNMFSWKGDIVSFLGNNKASSMPDFASLYEVNCSGKRIVKFFSLIDFQSEGAWKSCA